MRLLKDLMLRDLHANTIQKNMHEGEDLSKLPKDVVSAIQKNIRKGAEELDQKWANALELVHKAYEVEGVERPDPDMKAAWEQYETNLQYAVQQLADNRGMDGDWRMSSAMFHEAYKPTQKFLLNFESNANVESKIVEAADLNEVIRLVEAATDTDMHVASRDNTSARLRFTKWGIDQDLKVKIKKHNTWSLI